MRNTADWMREIEELYDDQKAGLLTPAAAMERNNTIGKMIKFTMVAHVLKQSGETMKSLLKALPIEAEAAVKKGRSSS